MMKKMKNNNINKTGLIIGAFCLIMVSCKAPSLTPTEKIELPEFYMDRENGQHYYLFHVMENIFSRYVIAKLYSRSVK